MTHDEYIGLDASSLAATVRAGDVTAVELLDIALARLEELNPALNAVVRLMEEDARAAAQSVDREAVFAGVPFLAKDLHSRYAGHPTSGASRLTAGLVAKHDSELVKRLRKTGVSVFGKTNLPEFGLVPFSESELWGPCRNPWDIDRTPGGSSGGAGAAVGAAIVPMAGGGDGGGSIRIPASCCGLFGLKPTRGRVPTGPDDGQMWRGFSVEHVLTRSVRDSATMLDATHGPDAGAPYEIAPPERPFLDEVTSDPGRLLIGWTTEPTLGSDVHPDCVAAVEDAARLLTELGHDVRPAAPTVEGPAFARAFLLMIASEVGADITDAENALGRRARRSELEPTTWALGLLSTALSAKEVANAMRTMERTGRSVGSFFTEYDLLLTPTLATPPARIGELAPTPTEQFQLRVLGTLGSGRLIKMAGLLDEAAKDAFDFTPWTPLYNMTGQPAMSVPLYWNGDDLPIGVHFAARFGHEATLLRLAGQLERARPWFDRLPGLARGGAGS
jgi:amidase